MSSHGVRGRGNRYSKGNYFNDTGYRNYKPMYSSNVRQPVRKIIHDNNCCREISINLELDAPTNHFLIELKALWDMLKTSPQVVEKLHNYFNRMVNPYVQTLKLLYNCKDFNNVKNKTLPLFIMEEFRNWCKMYRNKIIHLLTPELKIDALKIISKQSSSTLTNLVSETYEMTASGDIFLDIIRCSIEKKKYKEACQYAALLKLHNAFSVTDFVVPLILQDKLSCVDEFLKGSKTHQEDLVVFLDSALKKPPLRDAIGDELLSNIPEIKYDKLHSKPWKKLIARFLKMFKLSTDLTPNLNKRRNDGALQFLIRKRFIENTIGGDSWKEMIEEAIGEDKNLQKELVYSVAQFGEHEEAYTWAVYYNVDQQDWPQTVRMILDDPEGHRQQQRNEEENWDNQTQSLQYLQYSLPHNTIHLIDNVDKFQKFVTDGLTDVNVVGIDCEWKPSFAGTTNELALMQIATRENVFVIDMINLSNQAKHLWLELNESLFQNCDIHKLGFNITNDITMLKRAVPELNFNVKNGYLDLDSLYRQIERHTEVVLPYEGIEGGGPSLSTLIFRCLGQYLDKSNQFSNWEKRPLRDAQLLYAALDAYCLIQAYDVLKQCCEKAGISFDDLCENVLNNDKKFTKKKKKPSKKSDQDTEEQPPSPIEVPIPANALKVVCDTNLQRLGKHLRKCGINTVILENNENPMQCVRSAHEDNRYIITKGNPYDRYVAHVKPGHCLRIISENVDEQLKEVLQYYKVVVTKDDVFSRCQTCNGNNFIKISRSTMNALLVSSKSRKTAVPADYYFEEEEATGFSSEDEHEEARPRVPTTRKWELYSDEKVDVGLCQTKLGAYIQVQSVPEELISKQDFFYVCEECGKVYWDGSHFERVLSGKLHGIVS